MRLGCVRCGATDAIDPAAEPGAEMVCGKCGAKVGRGEIDLERLKVRVVVGRERAAELRAAEAAAATAARAEALAAVCPECGDDLFTAEFGCPKCGAGQRPFLARHPGLITAAAFVGPAALGVAGFAAFGAAPRTGPVANLAFILAGAGAVAFGIRVITKPGSFVMMKSHGTDTIGMPINATSHVVTPEEGLGVGAILVVAGLGFIVLGIFFGVLAP